MVVDSSPVAVTTRFPSKEDPQWIRVIIPVFTDSKTGLENICLDPTEISFYSEKFSREHYYRNDEEYSEKNEINNSLKK